MTPSLRPAAFVDRHGGFASRIAARHACGIGAPSAIARRGRASGGLGLVVLRTSRVVRMATTAITQHSLHVAPRFAFFSQSRSTVKLMPRTARLAGERVVVSRHTKTVGLSPSPQPGSPSMTTVLRHFRPVTRREPMNIRAAIAISRDVAPASPQAARAAILPTAALPLRREGLAPPLGRSMVRSAERPLTAAIRQLEKTVQTLSKPPADILLPARAAAPPFPDTSAIAEQVLRTLDHRVIAMRERMGRR